MHSAALGSLRPRPIGMDNLGQVPRVLGQTFIQRGAHAWQVVGEEEYEARML